MWGISLSLVAISLVAALSLPLAPLFASVWAGLAAYLRQRYLRRNLPALERVSFVLATQLPAALAGGTLWLLLFRSHLLAPPPYEWWRPEILVETAQGPLWWWLLLGSVGMHFLSGWAGVALGCQLQVGLAPTLDNFLPRLSYEELSYFAEEELEGEGANYLSTPSRSITCRTS